MTCRRLDIWQPEVRPSDIILWQRLILRARCSLATYPECRAGLKLVPLSLFENNPAIRTILVVGLMAFVSFAQSAPRADFAAASVKLSRPDRPEEGTTLKQNYVSSPGHISLINVPLSSVIEWAYNVRRFQVSGPDWITEARYDIVAKADAPASVDELRLMSRGLLMKRFGLVAHDETREMRVYALEVGKLGHKMRQSGSGSDPMIGPHIRGITMAQLAEILSGPLRVPVIDSTGLEGPYDFSLNMLSKVPPGADADPLSAIGAAVEQELGLRLDSKKMPVHVVVIDHLDKTPVDN